MSDAAARERAVATLRRIAFLLERAQASTYRSGAYRAAARTVAGTDPARLHALATAGALTDLPAVGARTAEVVARALAGRDVPILDELAAEAGEQDAALDGAARRLHDALRGDLHTHTDASDGAAPLEEMVLAAVELGRDYVAITDHSPRLTVANGLSAERLRRQLERIVELRDALGSFDVLTGIEVDVLDDGTLDQEPELLDELDVVVASVHSRLRADREAMTRRMLTAVRDPRTDVLGHCTGRRLTGRPRPPSDFDARAVFDACAEHGVAVEINCRPDRLDPPHELLQLAVDAGCTFSIDSDAHAPGQLDWLRAGCERAAAHGIGPDRVLSTRPAAEVRAHGRR